MGFCTRRGSLVLSTALFLALGSTAHAAPIQFNFSGECVGLDGSGKALAPATPGPEGLDDRVDRHPMNPGSQGAVAAERTQPLPDSDEDILNQLLGFLLVA